jgi:hypothetical protein
MKKKDSELPFSVNVTDLSRLVYGVPNLPSRPMVFF